MTAKRKPRGSLARLDVLEEARALRAEEVRAANWAHIEAAEARLSARDRAAWQDAVAVTGGEDPDILDRMRKACAHLPTLPDLPHSAKEEAEAWGAVALERPDGEPLLCPPADRVPAFVAYFEVCAAWCDREAVRVPLSLDVQRLARWGAVLWRFEAALCEVLGGSHDD
ncbi:hypothetical protein [Deinococcus navajonensis]|uniref:Uncharacterized protein n=1 Tax=Deinococcus navajonensis TaxID=309884 RepID=A0ABV8XQS5_9DEIO